MKEHDQIRQAAQILGSRGGKQRANNLTPKKLSEIGKKGVKGRMKKLTKEQRRLIASNASRARWDARDKALEVSGLERFEVEE